jgi:membrane protein implicated in regulation of membrane protease activity
MRHFLRDNGLSVALVLLFLISILGQAVAGWRALVEELHFHELPPVGFAAYLTTGHFLSATFENWESEFLQMSVYVLLTVVLVQKGSSESKKPDEVNPEDEAPSERRGEPDAPWPVHRGGLLLRLYSHSLSIALLALFLLSFWLHLAGSTQRSNEEALRHHQPTKTMTETLVEPEFWYESFQNWQSEFLSMGVLVVLGIFLRERGSPESKPVAAPHAKTGH